jgi:hypothetical protein
LDCTVYCTVLYCTVYIDIYLCAHGGATPAEHLATTRVIQCTCPMITLDAGHCACASARWCRPSARRAASSQRW